MIRQCGVVLEGFASEDGLVFGDEGGGERHVGVCVVEGGADCDVGGRKHDKRVGVGGALGADDTGVGCLEAASGEAEGGQEGGETHFGGWGVVVLG